MNIENQELIEKTTSVLDKIMNYFKKGSKQTNHYRQRHPAPHRRNGRRHRSVRGCRHDATRALRRHLHHGSTGSKIAVKGGQVQQVTPP